MIDFTDDELSVMSSAIRHAANIVSDAIAINRLEALITGGENDVELEALAYTIISVGTKILIEQEDKPEYMTQADLVDETRLGLG